MPEQRQVWTVVYDSDTPSMDGTHPPIRMAEMSQERAEMSLGVIQERSARAPKRNLRIETRYVTEWTPWVPVEEIPFKSDGSFGLPTEGVLVVKHMPEDGEQS